METNTEARQSTTHASQTNSETENNLEKEIEKGQKQPDH